MQKLAVFFHSELQLKTLWILIYWGCLLLVLCIGNEPPDASKKMQIAEKMDDKVSLVSNKQKTYYTTDKMFRISDSKPLGYRFNAKNPTNKQVRLLMGWCAYDRDFQRISAAQFNAIEPKQGTVIFDVKSSGRRSKLLILTDSIVRWKNAKGKKNIVLKKDIPLDFPQEPLKRLFLILDVKEINPKVVEVSVWTSSENGFLIPSGTEIFFSAVGGSNFFTDGHVLSPQEEKVCKSRLLCEKSTKGGFCNDKWPIGAVYAQPIVWSSSSSTVISDCNLQ